MFFRIFYFSMYRCFYIDFIANSLYVLHKNTIFVLVYVNNETSIINNNYFASFRNVRFFSKSGKNGSNATYGLE